MANARGKEVDTTFLSLEMAADRGFIHRDYIAHVFRWNHVCKYLHQGAKYKTAHVLDVGCGRETPLPKMLFSMRMTHTTGSYTGIDYGPINKPLTISDKTTKWNMELFEKTDFVKWAAKSEHVYDTITCFEMLEHVEPYHSYETLKAIRSCLEPDGGTAFISTPVYDPKAGAAANHVNEMSYDGLEWMINAAGLKIVETYGTFASQRDYKPVMSDEERRLFDRLSEYYESNVVSVIFAPLFPKQSRNVLWRLEKCMPVTGSTKHIMGPDHSNSDKWDTHIAKILADTKKAARR